MNELKAGDKVKPTQLCLKEFPKLKDKTAKIVGDGRMTHCVILKIKGQKSSTEWWRGFWRKTK